MLMVSKRIHLLLLNVFTFICFIQGSNSNQIVRVKRELGGSQSLLTVEWEGIQTGDHPDASIGGFAVEYRAEKDTQWHVHDGIIPYKGPNLQYRVQIPRLPTGIAYFVRIKVLGKNGKILVETPEIRARNEMVSIKCESDELTAPKSLKVTQAGQYSIAISWEPPECGSVGEYHIELAGVETKFDVHRLTVTHPSISVTNLLPGTEYHLRVRAADRANVLGPWNEQEVISKTEGEAPQFSDETEIDYRTDSELRISWQPYSGERLQYYEVMAVEANSKGNAIERARVSPLTTSHVFAGLQPDTQYEIGVIAFVDHEPKLVHKLLTKTAPVPPISWEDKPTIAAESAQQFLVHWKKPELINMITKFVIEYRLPNETEWRKYDDLIVDDETKDYHILFDGIYDGSFYSFRILAVDDQLKLLAKTAEITIGSAATESCAGDAGVPQNVRSSFVSESTIQFTWEKPSCDESYGPIDGYEYALWNAASETQPETASYVGQNAVAVNSLDANTRYAFRVRSRAGHGHSIWSDIVHASTEAISSSYYEHNINQLRIVLAPPRSYLAWTPVNDNRKNISRFKLSYKKSAGEEWTHIIEAPEFFKCPDGVADEEDFCYNLSELSSGTQYTANVVYELMNGEWTTATNPLFFILVEAGGPSAPTAPHNLQISPRDASSVEIRWLPPLSSMHISFYQIDIEDLYTHKVRTEKVPGTNFAHVIGQLSPYSIYNLTIRAGSDFNELGLSASSILSLRHFMQQQQQQQQQQPDDQQQPIVQPVSIDEQMRTSTGCDSNNAQECLSYDTHIASFGIEKPRIEQRGSRTLLYWTVGGSTSTVASYQIDLRSDSDRDWQQFGDYVPHSESEIHFRQELTGLQTDKRYYVRVAAVDRSRDIIVTSDATSFSVNCQVPDIVPTDVRVENVPDGVRILWSVSESIDEECEPYFLITGYQNGSPFSERVDGRYRDYVFRNTIGGDWQVMVRVGNRAGIGPISALTQSQGESIALTSRPQVTARDGDLYVEWSSTGNGRSVFGYRVQYKTDYTGWTPYGQIVPYIGDNKQYAQLLTGLRQGSNYTLHVQVLDRNSYIMFTSPEVLAKTVCSVPTHPPSQLQVQAADSRHIVVTWAQPPQSTWQCSDIQVELEVLEPKALPLVALDGRQTRHVFDSEANQQWSVRIRTKNSAGHSPWSQLVSTKSPSVGELIVGPTVTYKHGIPTLTWSSKERVDDLLRGYQLERKGPYESEWQKHGSQIAYNGWQRPYFTEVSDLPAGQNYQVRILALDANNGVAYTSPAVNIRTKATCTPPRRPPSDIRVVSLGPTQIRVSWRTLHESEWNCDRLWYIVKYSTPHNQGFKNLTNGEDHAIFDSEPFIRWNVEVQAANPSGESHFSRSESAQTEGMAPGPVRELRIYPQSSDTLQVSWEQPYSPNGRISGYEVTYQLLSRGMCNQIVERPVTVTSDKSSITLDGLSAHSKYRVSVAAITNIAGERMTQEVQTEQGLPTAPPIHLRASSAQPTEMDVNWQAPACLHTNGEITEYEYEIQPIERHYTDHVNVIKNIVRDSTRVKLTNLTPFTKYSIRVRAFTRKGAGPWSQPVKVQTAPAAEIPPPPVVRVLSTGSDSAHLVWQEPRPAHVYIDKYKCQYAVAGTKQYQERQFPAYNPCGQEVIRMQKMPPPPSGSQLHCGRIDGLQPEKEYTFKVSAGAPDGMWSKWSESEVGRVSDSPVQVLSLNKLGGSASSILIGWSVRPTDISRVTNFRIKIVPLEQYRTSKPQTFTVDRSTLQYTIDNLLPNTRYNISVDATTDGITYLPGMSAEMHTDSTPLSSGVSIAPRVIEEQASSITLEWDASTDSSGGFIIEYRLSDGVWQQHSRRVPAHPGRRTYTSQIDQLPTNTVIDFRIRAVSLQNQQSAPSPEVRARTRCSVPSAPPQAVRVDAPSTNEVRISWARPAKDTWQCDQLNYEIGYKLSDQAEQIVTVPGDQTEYILPSEANTRCKVKLRCSNQVGSSPWSSEQTITTRQGIPGPVRDLKLRAKGPNEVHVQWLAPLMKRGTIVGYDISYRLKHRLACPDEEPRDVSRDFVTVYNHKDLEYILSGLLPFSLYEVRVRARTTELGPEETAEVATEPQPPSAPPLNLLLSYALERSMSFQWEGIDCSQRHGNIVNYEYEIQGQDDWAKLERQIANTTDTKVTIEGLTPFTKYIMRAKAYNSVGGGPNTENLDAMTIRADAPLPPQDLVVAQEGTNYFMISWLPPYPPYGPHDSYKIRYQMLEMNEWTEIEKDIHDHLLKCPTESPRYCFNVTGLESGRQFRVQVAARIEQASYGPWSTVTIANTLQILPDAPRAIELIDKTDHSLHVKWIPPSDPLGQISQYKVSIRSMDDPQDEPKIYLVNHPTLDRLLESLQPETSYNISISAGTKRGFGPSAWTRYSTDPFEVSSVVSAPLVTADGANALNVQWTGASDSKDRIRGYIVEYRSSDKTFSEYDGIVDHDSLKRLYNQNLIGLDADTLYFVRIKVVDRKQRLSVPSPEGSARTGCAAPLSPPSNVNVHSTSPYQIRVNWQSPIQTSWQCSNIRYRLEYVNGTSAEPNRIEIPSSATDRTLSSAPNTVWRVRVRVENDAGESDWSKEVSVTTSEGAPSAVETIDASPSGPESASITWEPPADPNGKITGYTLVYQLKSRGECGPRTAQPITKNANDERLSLDGLLPDSMYNVHVTAYTSQAGPQSKIVTFKTDQAIPAGAPLNARVGAITQKRGDYTWQPPDCELQNGKITEYEYELESVDDWDENRSGRISTQRVSFDSLVPYTKYRVRVRAENSIGPGPWTEWTSFRTLPAAPLPPTDVIEEESHPHAIEISFLPPSPPHGILNEYRIRYTPTGQLNYKEIRVHGSQLECSDHLKRDRLCYRVAGLEPEQEYEIQVAAHTEGGTWGGWSDTLTAKTHEQNIPVLERELEIVDTKPNSITVQWQGLDADQSNHVVGYALEYKSENGDDWKEYNGITRHRQRQNSYKVQVRGLEPATEYFFRLKVVGKNDKRGSAGPELKAQTNCGKPEEAPADLKLVSDFEAVKLTWTNPEDKTWKCSDVEYLVDFVNTTSRGVIVVSSDAPNELTLPTVPGTKWDMRMRTQTVESGQKSSYSAWSDRVSLVTQALPGELFLKVEPKSPTSAVVIWDLADQDQKWNYGVDISYRLKKLGSCAEQKTGTHEAVTNYNVQDKQLVLNDLKPGSEYEVVVTPRKPPNLRSSIVTPKTVRHFRTSADLPTGAPTNLRGDVRRDTELGFKWEAPACEEQNGEITQYEYELVGVEEWNDEKREGVTPRTNAVVDQLKSGLNYNVRVRAYTSEGPGPWSEVVQLRTTGTELGPPRELIAILTKPKAILLTWLPPYPERTPITVYKIRYSPRADDSNPEEIELSSNQLSCLGYDSSLITQDNLCTTVSGLQPDTTYRFAVQAQSISGAWGEWSPAYFATTRSSDIGLIPGRLRLITAGHDNLKVNWTAPSAVHDVVDQYLVHISAASFRGKHPKEYVVSADESSYHFHDLEPNTHYNITVNGLSGGKRVWFISEVFSTTDFGEGLLSWLPAPTDLKLLEKSDRMMHVAWSPPEIFDPQYKDLITHYRVTIAPFNYRTGKTGRPRNYTVPYPRTSIRFDDLTPATIYNITVQAGTDSGYGQILWGVYSTLHPGQNHILRLVHRTPTTLTVEWEKTHDWQSGRGYLLTWKGLHSVYQQVRLHKMKSASVNIDAKEYTIDGLEPSTVYNVTLQPIDDNHVAWGAYATLPPGYFMVRNLVWCDRSNFALSLTWEPVERNKASHYQVRHLRLKEHDAIWTEEAEKRSVELLCPKDGCNRHCYLVFNLDHNPSEYVLQVRAKVDGEWNRWRTAGKPSVFENAERKKSCCIMPPPYIVQNIGAAGTFWEVDISPVESQPQNVSRYYVVVDEREPAGSTNWTELTDKVTASKKKLPYYVAASFNADTLPGPRKVQIGDGSVIGGYLNYPLVKGKKYNYEIYSVWELNGKPAAVARQRASPFAISGWPWWWLLLLLLLLLLLILLTCCLLWCLQGRYRERKVQKVQSNGQSVPLLGAEVEKNGMERNMHALSSRVDDIRTSLEQASTTRGDFEDGYVRGFRDANKLGSASAARRRLDDDYAGRDDRFHEGYVKGLRDAGMTGMSTSMHNLAQSGQGGGYSSGYMQGFRDGNSGMFGDRITTNLLRRLEEQYPNQEEFRTGYIDGFKEGVGSKTTERKSFEESRRLQESLTKLTEILQDKSRGGGGDEVHTTKIFHVYNQQPEGTLFTSSTAGRQLEQELEELTSSSRRGTLRRHYTPGDYLKYGSDVECYDGSLARNRRSLSASALEGSERARLYSGTGTSYISRASTAADRSHTDTYARRYNYRSRSDVGSPRRYASQTLLDGARPGPSTPHTRRDALHTLQRELDTLSRSPADRQRGYSSDTGYMNDTLRSRARTQSNYDYDTAYYAATNRSELKTPSAGASAAPPSVVQKHAIRPTTSKSYSSSHREGGETVNISGSTRTHNWPDDLIDIVTEPMGQTLDRMKKYSRSISQGIDRDGTPVDGSSPMRETVEERYHRTYKEEFTTGRR